MKNTFNTQSYKDGFIHTCYDNGKEIVQAQFKDFSIKEVKSIHAAKVAITKHK